MLRDINKFNFLTAIIFLLAFICLMLNIFTNVFNVIFAGLCSVGFVMLTIIFVKRYKSYLKLSSEEREVLIMEMVQSGEMQAEAKLSPYSSAQERIKKREKSDKFLPIIVSVLGVVAFIAIFIILLV